MRHYFIISALTALLSLFSVTASAYDIAVENEGVTIYYNYINDGTELEVTFKDTSDRGYSGIVVIPDEVTYLNRTRKVTSIGESTFRTCKKLTSVVIPNSVTTIGDYAFSYCNSLASITIPNSVKTIGDYVFQWCRNITSIIISNGVTSIGERAFYVCTSLDDVTIPNSVTSIGGSAFAGCESLKSVTMSNNVTCINDNTFQNCFILTSIVIPNSVLEIGEYAFQNCYGLTSIHIPNSVIKIGSSAFSYCTGLTSITIPYSVTEIGNHAFDGIDFVSVTSEIEEPFIISGASVDSRVFTKNTFYNSTLYVPKGTIEKYKSTDGWKEFVFIEEMSGDTQKCATPTIAYNKGTVEFACETEGVEFVAEARNNSDVQSGNASTMSLQPPVTTITVYAKKDGYTNSDTATATISWQNGQPVFEGFSNVTIDSVYDLNGDGKVSTADIQVIINEMKK